MRGLQVDKALDHQQGEGEGELGAIVILVPAKSGPGVRACIGLGR